MADDELHLIGPDEIAYRLDLTPAQLKITWTALKSMLDDFGHDERDVHEVLRQVLDKLPDEHAIRAIQLDHEPTAAEEILAEAPKDEGDPPDVVA